MHLYTSDTSRIHQNMPQESHCERMAHFSWVLTSLLNSWICPAAEKITWPGVSRSFFSLMTTSRCYTSSTGSVLTCVSYREHENRLHLLWYHNTVNILTIRFGPWHRWGHRLEQRVSEKCTKSISVVLTHPRPTTISDSALYERAKKAAKDGAIHQSEVLLKMLKNKSMQILHSRPFMRTDFMSSDQNLSARL